MTTLLEYSSTETNLEKLPEIANSGTAWKWKKILFLAALILSVSGSFIYAYILNSEVGLILAGLALVPLAGLILISLFASPRSEVSFMLMLLAIIWGGAGSTNLTLVVVEALSSKFGVPDLNTTVVVQAAIVEELAKAVFLFALFFFAKHLIRTPLAGAVLGILVGAGFAFIENIMYFNNAFLQGSWESLWTTVVMRAGMSFFLHALATMFTGMFIGYVVQHRNNLGFWKKLFFIEMGLIASMTVHGMWNGMASLTTDQMKWGVLYLLFWIPFVALMTVTLVIIRKNYNKSKKETMVSAARLGYIRMAQAERMNDKKERKALYKASSSEELIRWESSLLRIQHWNESISSAKKERRNKRLNHAKSKDMMRLAQVVTKV